MQKTSSCTLKDRTCKFTANWEAESWEILCSKGQIIMYFSEHLQLDIEFYPVKFLKFVFPFPKLQVNLQ